jgi:hypothetical protein
LFELYASNGMQTLAEGAMIGHTPRGMQVAQETLVIFFSFGISVSFYSLAGFNIFKFCMNDIFQEKMVSRNFFLNPRMGSDLLIAAAGEKVITTNHCPLSTKHKYMNYLNTSVTVLK